MNSIEGWISESVVTALGWTLLHFLWQGSLIAVLYGTINVLLQRSSAAARYFLGCASLAMMMVLPAITFFLTQSVQQPLAKQSNCHHESTSAPASVSRQWSQSIYDN